MVIAYAWRAMNEKPPLPRLAEETDEDVTRAHAPDSKLLAEAGKVPSVPRRIVPPPIPREEPTD
jgi:hypothetical protein